MNGNIKDLIFMTVITRIEQFQMIEPNYIPYFEL